MTGIHFLDARGPDGVRLYAIGDVHGRLDLLAAMHEQIADDLLARPSRDYRIIHLGDYTDRGPDSKGVLDFLIARIESDRRNVALMGNHDEGFLIFLDKADPHETFARYGGTATARSYGVDPDFSSTRSTRAGRDALAKAVPQSHIRLLETLPRSVDFGDFFFCHAGIRPGVPLDAQDPHDLIWIRREFLDHCGLHDKVIVHGHTIVEEPEILPNRVDVDTGAYKTGRLTALVIDGLEKSTMDVSD